MRHLLAWLPLLVIPVVAVPHLSHLYLEWERSHLNRLNRPNYDDPNGPWQKPALTKSPSEMQSEYWEVVPGSVEDGNSFRVQQDTRTATVRLACIRAPRVHQLLGVKSRDYLRSLLAQANNQVILSVADTDRQGRKVAEVNVPTLNSDEEKFVQYEMVVAGWAYPYEKFSDHCPNWDAVQQGAEEAEQHQLGVWKTP